MKSVQGETYEKIYITGATGWVGRTFLHELQSIIPAEKFNDKIRAFGSKRGSLISTNYKRGSEIIIPINPLTELREESAKQSVLVFHSAFLTKDRISRYGIDEYTSINKHITNTVCDL